MDKGHIFLGWRVLQTPPNFQLGLGFFSSMVICFEGSWADILGFVSFMLGWHHLVEVTRMAQEVGCVGHLYGFTVRFFLRVALCTPRSLLFILTPMKDILEDTIPKCPLVSLKLGWSRGECFPPEFVMALLQCCRSIGYCLLAL